MKSSTVERRRCGKSPRERLVATTLMISDCVFRYILLPAGPNQAAKTFARRTRIYMVHSPAFSSSLRITAVFIAAINLEYAARRYSCNYAWLTNGLFLARIIILPVLPVTRTESRKKYYYLQSLCALQNNNDIN